MLGGQSAYIYSPPWNYEYISVVYILALPATLVIIIGTVRATTAAVFRANKVWLLILGSLFVAGFGMAYMNLRIPYYAQAKAFYGLFVVMPVALTFALGFDGLDGWLRDKGLLPVRIVLYGWFGTLALAIFFSFFVSPAQKHKALYLPALANSP